MLDLETARRVILRELDVLLARLDAASDSDWQRPVRCEGWIVLDLAIHCCSAPRASAEAFRRMSADVTETPPPPVSPSPARSDVIATLRSGRDELAAALADLTDETLERVMPLFFTSIPGVFGIHVVVFELGMHRNDLEWAFGREEPLPPEVCDVAATLARFSMPMFGADAEDKPTVPVGYALKSANNVLELRFVDGEWRSGEGPSVPMCVIEGDDSAITLFSCGRIAWDHPSLSVSGEKDLAPRFKDFFPGPVNEAADRTVLSPSGS